MASTHEIALLGFLPWRDEARGIDVRENPSFLGAERAAALLRMAGVDAVALGVEVSHEGVLRAAAAVDGLGANVIVAAGQTPGEPRIERFGRVPSTLAPAAEGEHLPWLLAPDADELARLVNAHTNPAAGTAPFRPSDDAGAYFCDHLCVELARLARRTGVHARFLHLTATDGCPPAVREARIAQYSRQIEAVARYLHARAARRA